MLTLLLFSAIPYCPFEDYWGYQEDLANSAQLVLDWPLELLVDCVTWIDQELVCMLVVRSFVRWDCEMWIDLYTKTACYEYVLSFVCAFSTLPEYLWYIYQRHCCRLDSDDLAERKLKDEIIAWVYAMETSLMISSSLMLWTLVKGLIGLLKPLRWRWLA